MEDLEKQISHVEALDLDIVAKSQRLSTICKKAVDDLRFYILKNGFEHINEEIHFFKHINPHFLSKLYYHIKVYNIELNLGVGNYKTQIKYFKDELRKIDHYCNNNKEIWTYHSRGETDRDHQYFTRGKYDMSNGLDFESTFSDPSFTSLHGKTIARLRGSKDLIGYLNQRIEEMKSSPVTLQPEFQSLPFNGTSAEVIELCYALYKSKKINTDIKQIITGFGNLFDMDLKNFYQYFSNMKARKGERAKFLVLLKSAFEEALDEE